MNLRKICQKRLAAVFITAVLTLPAAAAMAGLEEDAWAAFNNKEYAKAYSLFLPLANSGNAKAADVIGWLLDEGKGVEKNIDESIRWYLFAADQGLSRSQYRLGVIYSFGIGVPKNPDKAAKWYRKAANQGYAEAQYSLASVYDEGKGVPKDQSKAAYWYKKAADQGHLGALYNLGNLYFHGEGVPQDKTKGVELAGKAARKGRLSALAFLGAIYMDGSAPGGYDAVKAWMFVDLAYRMGEKRNIVLLGLLEPKMRPEEIEQAKRRQAQWLKETGLSVPPRK